MKGKRTFKRFLAVVMAVVFTVTGITFTPSEKDANAAITYTNVPTSPIPNFIDNSWQAFGFHDGTYTASPNTPAGYSGGGIGSTSIDYRTSDNSDGLNRIVIPLKNSGINAMIPGGMRAGTTYYYMITVESDAEFPAHAYQQYYEAFDGSGTITSPDNGQKINNGYTFFRGTFTPNATYESRDFGRSIFFFHSTGVAHMHISIQFSTSEIPTSVGPTSATTTTTAAPTTTEEAGWTDYAWPENINGLQFAYTGSYFKYKVDSSTGTVYLKNKDTNARECQIVYRPNNQNYPEYSSHSYNYRLVFESDTSFSNSNIYGGHYYHNCNTLASSSAIVANQEKVVTLNNYSPPADYTGDGPCLRFDGASFPAGATIAVKSFTVTEPSSVSDPENVSATRDSATSGTITWSNASTMPSGQIYYIYDGNTKIGETTAQSNTSYQVTGIADFNAHSYTVKGYYSGDTSTGVSATIPAFDPWIKLNNQTVNINGGDDGSLYGYGNQEIGYYYGSLTSLSDLKTKQFRSTPYPTNGYAVYERINLPASLYSGLANGHTYKMRLKYKASATGGYMILRNHGEADNHWTVGEITNSGNTDNTLVSDNSFVYNSSTTYDTAQIVLGSVATGTEISDIRVDFVDLTTPVAPASVTATRSTSTWNGIDISFAAGSGAPAGQTYSIEVDGDEIENNASPGTTYSTTIDYDEDVTVEVIAHIAGLSDSTSTTINIPEYKNIRHFNSDPFVAAYNLGETYGNQTYLCYKVDSNGVHIKNTNTSDRIGMNLLNKGTVLSTNAPYYTTFTYTSNVADTQTVTYGVNTDYFYSRGSLSQTTAASSGNVISFIATPGDKTGNNCYAGITWTIPANEEFIITATTCALAASAVDVASVVGVSSTANTVVASWVEGSNPPAYQNYDVDLLDSSNAVVDSTTVPVGTTTYTFSNVAKGTGYKVRVKARVDETYASAAGVSSSAIEVHDPAPVAPASVTVTRSTSVWNGIDIRFTAGSNPPAGQTYSIEVGGTQIQASATPGTTYSTTIAYDTNVTVEVIAHNDGTTASTSETINIPEYKPISQLNNDSINTDYGEYYADYDRLVYKIDSNGIHIKNNDSVVDAGMNFIYKKYHLTADAAYLATMTYTSDTAYTQVNASYGVDSVTEGRCVSQGQTNVETAVGSGNEVTFMVTPTAEQIAAGDANAYISLVVPAGGEFIVTDFTLSSSNPPQDLASVGATSTTSTPNQINVTLTKPSPDAAPSNQVYEIYLNDTSAGTTTLVDTVSKATTSYTINNVAKGTYTVTVKAKVASTYASQAGVTSSSVTVHDPQPVAPASVTATENANNTNTIDVSFTAGSNPPAGQQYSISLVNSSSQEYEVKAAGTAVPGTTYTINEINNTEIPVGTYTVKVYAHNDGTTAVQTTTVTLNWNRAANDWSTSVANWQMYGSYNGSSAWGVLGYQGSSLQAMQVKAINPSGDYSLQMRIANANLYAGLTEGMVYNMSIKFKSDAAGTVKWTQAPYQAQQTLSVTDYSVSGTKNEMASTFTYHASANVDGNSDPIYFAIELSGLAKGTVLSDFEISFTPANWQPIPAGDVGAIAVGSDGTDAYNAYAGNLEYYYGSESALLNTLRVRTMSTPTAIDAAWQNAIRIPNNVPYTSLTNGHKYRMTITYTATGDDVGGTFRVHQQGYGTNGDDTVTSGTNTVSVDFVNNTALNTSNRNTQLQLAAINPGTEIKITNIAFAELPKEVAGVGIGSQLGMTNAGGSYVSTGWDDQLKVSGTTYEISLLDSSDQVLNVLTATVADASVKFVDGATDANGDPISIDPNTTYKTQVVTLLGGERSDPVYSPTENTGEWIKMGKVDESGSADVLTVPTNGRVYSVWANLAYHYNYTSSLSTLKLKRLSAAEASADYYHYYKVGQKNSTVYSTLQNGQRARLTATFTANAAAAGGTVVLKQNFGSDTTTNHTVTSGSNTITVDFNYSSSTPNEYTELFLGGLGEDSEITGLTFSTQVLETWTDGTADGGWHDVGDYAYHIPSDESAQYSTDSSSRFAMKIHWQNYDQWTARWKEFFVGTNEKTVYPGSVYSYSINFNRTHPVTNPDDNQNRVYLHILYDTGVDRELGYTTCDESGNVSFNGSVTIPDDATTARLYWKFQWATDYEIFSVDPLSGSKYTFEETWRAVDRIQEVDDGKYVISDRDGDAATAAQYKPSQTGSTTDDKIDVRIEKGSQYNAYTPNIKTKFANWNLEEGKEYVATVSLNPDKSTDGFRLTGSDAGRQLIANQVNTFEITFIYEDGYDIQASFGWIGQASEPMVVSDFSVSLRDGSVTMPLENNGTNVVANWANIPQAAGATKLVYTSNGELQIEDITGQTSFTFGQRAIGEEFNYPDNETEVELYDSYTEGNPGNKLLRATALADLTITNARVDGTAHANTNNIIKVTVKNIGTGRIIASDYNQKFIYVLAKQDDWKNYKYLCPDPLDGKKPHDPVLMDPNEVFDDTSPVKERPNIDAWRVEQEGTYTIRCSVNETKIIREKNYTNNSFTFRKEVTTQLADDTAVLGFQLNTNKATGAVSELNPTYRTVCRANKQVTVKEGDKAWTGAAGSQTEVTVPTGGPYNVTEYGFIYAKHDDAGITSKNEDELMSLNGAESNNYIYSKKANSSVDITKWTTKEGSTYNSDNSYFFALTLQDLWYTTDQYETVYTYRSYLKFEANGVTYTVYPKDVYSTSLYDIAEDLYRYKKMPSEAGHNFLYDNVLNIVSMKHNAAAIGKAMGKKLKASGQMTSSSSPHYKSMNYVYKDMSYYALCSDNKGDFTPSSHYDPEKPYAEASGQIYLYGDNTKRVTKTGDTQVYEITRAKAADETLKQIALTENGYTYTHDYEFRSVRLDRSGQYNSFLAALNASKTESSSNYASVYDWIYGEVPHDTGFYKLVEYSWDSNLDKDYGTE